MQKLFMTELKQPIAPEMQRALRLYYLPVIGPNATTIYLTLIDFHYFQEGVKTFQPLREVQAILQLDEPAFEGELKKLEATGLLRRFVSPDESKYIFVINAPQSALGIRQNSFLYKTLISKIGENLFEKFEFSTRVYQYDKSEYQEVTTKFQDLFTLHVAPPSARVETPGTRLASFSSTDEAMRVLSPAQFVTYLTEQRPSPAQAQALLTAQHLGLSTIGANAVAHYVIDKNGKFVTAHFLKIVNDFEAKQIREDTEVLAELASARTSVTSSSKAIFQTDETSLKFVQPGDQDAWDELFSSLAGSS